MTGVNHATGRMVVGFGEAMIRFTPPGNERLERTHSLNLSPGGAELNTLVTLACLGLRSRWVTTLPDSPLGRYVERQARAHHVEASFVNWTQEHEGRTGVYFLEEGTDPRPSAVVYDRAGSAFANIKPGDYDWAAIFEGACAFHVSGITPALSSGCRAETFAAVQAANTAGVPVFFDLNYRAKLWSESDARSCFLELAPLVDVMIASRSGIRVFFGIDGDHETVMHNVKNRLGIAACVLTRKRSRSSRSLKLAALALGVSGEVAETDWKMIEVVDRLGGGDAFAGGFIAGYLEDHDDLNYALGLGLAASALKHTMPGDFLCATRLEIEAAVTTESAGDLQR